MLNTLGWGLAVVVMLIGFALARIPWRSKTFLGDPEIKSRQDERSS